MKRKLFLLLCALLTMIGVQAADLPASGSGEYFIKNVETGTFLKGDMYWGTKACVWDDPYLLTLTYVSEGVYTIKSQQNNGGQKQYISSGDDVYVDALAANMTFTEVDGENHYFTINNGTGNLTAVSQTEDGVQLYKVMATSETSTLAQWEVISKNELIAALDVASASNPVVATFFMKDPGFDVKSVNAGSWTKSNVDLDGGGNAGHSAESWNKANFNISQTVTGLPNGKYRVECYGYYRWNNGGNNNNQAAIAGHASGTEVLNAKLYAGTKEVALMSVAGDAEAMAFCQTMGWADNTPNGQWQAAACFDKGYYKNTLEDVVVTDGTLTIGVKKDTQAGTDWAVFDEFKLFYLGEDLSIYVQAYHDARDAANAVDQSAPMLGTALTALQTAISTYGSGVDEESKDALLTATSALSSATINANTSIAAYAGAASKLANMAILLEATNVYTAEAYAAYYSNPKAKFDARTLTTEEANTLENPYAVTAHHASNKVDDLLMSAFDEATEQWGTYHINTWSTEGSSDGSGFVVPFIEYWTGDNDKLADKTIHAQMTGLERGLYDVTAQVRLRLTGGQTAPVSGLSLEVNGGEASAVSGNPNYGAFYVANVAANGIVKTNGVLDINFIVAGANSSWISIKDVKFVRTGDIDPTDYRAAVAAKLTVAQGLVNEVMNADVASDLNTAIAATTGYEESSDIDALEQMVVDLEAAIAAATTSIANYQEAAVIINAASTLDAAGQASYASNETVLQIKGGYDNKTLVAVTEEQKALCQTALIVATKAQTTSESDWTFVIQNNSFETGNFTGWTPASTDGDTGVKSNSNATYHIDNADGNYLFNTWNGDAVGYAITQALPDMPCGVYRLTARFAGKVDGKVDLIAGSSRTTFTHTATGTGTDVNVQFTVATPGAVTIGTDNATTWYKVDYFRLTLVQTAATAEDYNALNAAIEAAEAKVLGFEAGEYAPYNNKEAVAALNTAKAINQTVFNEKSSVQAATAALTDATWTANIAEVNAFYKGDFADYAEDTSTPLDYTPNGWTATNNFRLMLKNVETYPGLADASAGTAPMSWSGGITYGETAGYEMPLKANTIYRLQFKAAGWNNETRSGMSVSILNGTDGMALYNLGTPDRDIKGNATNVAGMTPYEVVFATGAAGNYVFHVHSGNNFVITDFNLVKAASQTLTITDGEALPKFAPGTYPSATYTRTISAESKYGTICLPFNVKSDENITFYNLQSVEGTTLNLTSADEGVAAGVPAVFKKLTADAEEISVTTANAEVIAAPVAQVGDTKLVGTFSDINVSENVEKCYYIKSNAFWQGNGNFNVKAYRAYIQTDVNEARLIIKTDGEDPTAINAIEAAEAEDGALKDGKYLIDGKVILVKNGVKYSANGQKLN